MSNIYYNTVSFARFNCVFFCLYVVGQTERLLKHMLSTTGGKPIIKGVQTTLYNAARTKLFTPHAANILILTGQGYGCNHIGKMLFAERCSKFQCNGYFLLNEKDWYAVDLSHRAVILIPDAVMQDWTKRLKHDMLEFVQPGGELIVIITTKDEIAEVRFKPFVLDASLPEYWPTTSDKTQFMDYVAPRNRIKIIQSNVEEICSYNDEDGRSFVRMSTRSRDEIVKLVGNIAWIKRLLDYMETSVLEGETFFTKPIDDIKNQLLYIETARKPLFVLFILIDMHPTLPKEYLNMFCKYCLSMASRRVRTSYQPLPGLSGHTRNLVDSYCTGHSLWDQLGHELPMLLNDRTAQDFLIEFPEGDITFQTENIRSSMTALLLERFSPEVILTCSETFLFNHIGKDDNSMQTILSSKRSRESLFNRFKNVWLSGNISNCVHHPLIAKHYSVFMKHHSRKDRMKMLKTVDRDSKACAIYHGMSIDDVMLSTKDFRNITEAILHSKKWKQIRREEFYAAEEKKAFERAVELNKSHTVDCFLEYGHTKTQFNQKI